MMLLKDGNEVFLRIDSLPYDDQNGIYLKYLGNDTIGMKMMGIIPFFWDINDDKITGPDLYDDDHTYRVTGVDYKNNIIWLLKM